jgi:capsular exopolysaccharide synthesis family protein
MDKHPSDTTPNDPPIVRSDEVEQRALVPVRRSPLGYGYDSLSSKAHPDQNPESGGLIEYWRILRQHKGTWVLLTFLGAVVGFLSTLPQTSVYQARTSIEIQGLNDNFMNMRQTTEVNEGGGSDPSEIPTQIKILESDMVLEAVVNQLKTPGKTITDNSRSHSLRRIFNVSEPDPPALFSQQMDEVARSVKAHASGQTRVIEITVDSPDPTLAANFANTLTTTFIQQNLEARWKSTEKTAEWLGHQLDDMRVKLERSEDALQQYARQSGLLFTDEKTNVSEEKLKQLQQELSAASAARIARQSTYELAQQASPDALPDVLNDGTLRDTAAKIRDLRSQIADLRSIYGPDYDKVRRAEAELAVLQSTFEQDRTAILSRIENEYTDAHRREELLQSAYNSQTRQVTGEGEKAIQYNILKREVDSNRQLYDAMLAQLKQSSIASAMRASNVRVVDTAKVPDTPYKPNRNKSTGVGALAGVFLGAAFLIMRSRADTTVQQPGESNDYLNVPELGIIPTGSHEKLGGIMPTHSTNSLSERFELEAWQRRGSLVAESFRSTLISILFTPEHIFNAKLQTIVLTSPGPTEGKSTVSSNLAIAISEVGRRVLLIDADMRRPRQHQIFEIDNETGLSSLLTEKTSLNGDRSLNGMIKETKIPGLFLLPAGLHSSSPTNLLIHPHMAALLKYLKEQFDVILIDTPPMLQIPDARVVGRLVDSVIMVIRAHKTTRGAIVAACQRFSEDGTKILGTILNDWNPKRAPDGYYGCYDHKNYSYYSKSDRR